ncbi:MAG: pseudouridine synthase [Desulfovibrio sp.]|jgi:23S rRNA pseudouridine1911/1915/1917 synthase|nr:pseudouridine synthase [Desulfovibrio sp.]
MCSAFVVSSELDGQRLDVALKRLLPQMGLRGGRRAIAAGLVLLNGRPEKAARRLRVGDHVEVLARPTQATALPRFIARQGDYLFVDKPAGLYCAHLAGGGPSLEELLPEVVPADCAKARLLQRLDRETSGIVCAALGDRAVRAFRVAEREGLCDKHYLALLTGSLLRPLTARFGLETEDRRKSRVGGPVEDATRWTDFRPLRHFDPEQAACLLACLGAPPPFAARELTLAACRIRRGARHQIRAHAAALGHPLWGDTLYGISSPPQKDALADQAASAFFLHHGALFFPGGRCVLSPPWPMQHIALE